MKKTIAISIVVTAIFIMGLTPTVSADEVNFNQIDFYLDGVPTLNSDWGSVDFTFTGQEPIMYFNLAAHGSWQVQNIPVLSGRGVGVEQTMTYYFDLGTIRGTDVTSLNHDYAFTSYILDTMPSGSTPASVGDDSVRLWAGIQGSSMPDLAAAKPLVGGEVSSSKKHAHKDFPNQECGKNECAPAAVSNSLKFLNTKHKLGMKDDKISIDEMKKATGWNNGAPANWWEKKKKYMEDNSYPITTRKITDMSKLAAEIDAGQDVEIDETVHVSSLIGITKLEDGRYSLDIAEDVDQGKKGGCKNLTLTYDPATGKLSTPGYAPTKFAYAVVECPKPKEVPAITPLSFLLALLSLIGLGAIAMRKMNPR